MAAGFHSGLTTLKELKLENLSAYRCYHGECMTDQQENQVDEACIKEYAGKNFQNPSNAKGLS